MPTLTAQDIPDLVKGTLYDLGPAKFNQIAQEIQYFKVFSKWFKQDKVVFDSGIGVQRTLMARYDRSAASHVGFSATDQTNITDVLEQIQVPWRHAKTSWGILYQTDVLMNRGKALIVNVVKPRRASALLALVQELEDRAWGSPPSSTDKVLPYGIQYWLTESATAGFNGSYPSGHTAIAGINLDNAPNFKNYTDQYTTVSKNDLIAKMRTAYRKTGFVSPLTDDQYRGSMGQRFRIYVNEPVIQDFENVGEGQNENLGKDIASMDGTTTFRRIPIEWIPAMDSRSDNPVYMVDHSSFFPVCLKGDYLRESEARQNPDAHNLYEVFMDITYNYVCDNRRKNSVITTG